MYVLCTYIENMDIVININIILKYNIKSLFFRLMLKTVTRFRQQLCGQYYISKIINLIKKV